MICVHCNREVYLKSVLGKPIWVHVHSDAMYCTSMLASPKDAPATTLNLNEVPLTISTVVQIMMILCDHGEVHVVGGPMHNTAHVHYLLSLIRANSRTTTRRGSNNCWTES